MKLGNGDLTKGFEAVKRARFVRVVPPAIELVDWDAVEGREPREERSNNNGSVAEDEKR